MHRTCYTFSVAGVVKLGVVADIDVSVVLAPPFLPSVTCGKNRTYIYE